MSRVCVIGLVVAVIAFVFVFDALAPASDDAHADSAAPHAKPTPLLGVRLADLLRARLGVDDWLGSTPADRPNNDDDDGDDDDDDNNNEEEEEGGEGEGEGEEEETTGDVEASADEAERATEGESDAKDDVAAWRSAADVTLVDRPDPMMSALFSWQRNDLQRWLQLLGVSVALQARVREQLVQRNMSSLEFVSKRADELAELLAVDDARGVQLIALGNALLRTNARQMLVLEQCAKLLSDADDDAGFMSDDVGVVFAAALRFVVRVVVLVLKLLMAFAALIFFGPDGFGLAVLRVLLRALAALMAVVTPLIRIAFPRFRFRIEENL